MIWFTSDSHYGHTNIAGPNVSKWKHGYRNFKNLEEQNAQLVKSINKVVKRDDILYHLGDVAFGLDNLVKFRHQINCKEIHLILGNHDHDLRENKKVNGVVDIPCRDLFNSVQDVLTIKTPLGEIFMSHYAHRVWSKSHHGVIHLYGHSHGTLPGYGKSMDVGVDAIYDLKKDYRPISLTEVYEIMDKIEIASPDRH